MANPEHLAILKQGVSIWNNWRTQNPAITPNLSGADLRWTEMSGANLSNVSLHRADLGGVILSSANLRGANLSKADLHATDLTGVDLSEMCLAGADLKRADLYGAKLSCADLRGANLSWVDMSKMNLRGANIEDAYVRYSQLSKCDLTEAKLTGAKLYATAKDDWVIQGVECRYIYWDEYGEIRSPKDRDLAPGEFEQLYRSLPTIEYIFENGISPTDPLIMDRVVQAIREQNPEFDIKIDSIAARGLAPSIKFTVRRDQQKELALQMVIAGYESRVQRLEVEKDHLYDLLSRAIDKAGTRLIEAGPGAVVAMDNATVNVEQHIYQAVELQKVIAEQPEDRETFAKVAKRKVMDVIGGAIQDFAKGKVREAAAMIVDICKDLGPVIVNTAAYAFFKNCLGH